MHFERPTTVYKYSTLFNFLPGFVHNWPLYDLLTKMLIASIQRLCEIDNRLQGNRASPAFDDYGMASCELVSLSPVKAREVDVPERV